MGLVHDIPYDRELLLRKEYTQDLKSGHGEYISCYVFAVTALPNRPLLFTCHTKDGAVISRLPIDAFCTKPTEHQSLGKLQLWSCFGGEIEVIQHTYLKGYTVSTKIGNNVEYGTYWFTIDTLPKKLPGLEATPDQHKTYNVIMLDNGNLAAMPNNRCLFMDSHFTSIQGIPKYKTNTNEWGMLDDDDFESHKISYGDSSDMFYKAKGEV